MLKILSVLFFGLVRASVVAAPSADALPRTAEGSFVQRKTLADVEVTLVSRGTYRFAKDRFFEWHTCEPMPSVFYATPTNWALTVNGVTSAHPLAVDVSSLVQVFAIKEVKEYVKKITVTPDTGFPTRVKVDFKNGDRLEIEMAPKEPAHR